MTRRLLPLAPAFRALVVAAALFPAAALGAAVKTPHVEAEIVAARTAIVPGEPLTVALRLAIEKGWHTYWRNPGDSGLPTTLAWTLPAGIAAAPIQWPAPRALPAGPLVNYGYEGEVLHLVELQVQPTLATGTTVELKARADWLVCKEICIPEGVDLALALPVERTSAPDARWAAPIEAARAALPRPLDGWKATAVGSGQTIELRLVPPPGTGDPGALRFFPYAEALIEPSRPQAFTRDGDAYVMVLPVSFNLTGEHPRLAGVLAAEKGFGAGVRAATVDAALAGALVAGPKPTLAPDPAASLAPRPADGLSLALALAFAFAGGIILNLMPCVFPVLSLKVLGFATHHDSRATLHREAIAFAAGVVLTFVLLGAALALLRAAGEQLGWGFQLQSPATVTALAMLFFVLALNLSGVFEFGTLAPSALAGFTARNRTVDAFASGVLAVVVASPCTAPFMGAALGYALAAPTAVTLAVFVALGVGMAVPYVTLAMLPGWRRRLPRPGPWLARLKELLAFPLYATVIWLAWVLGAQRDNDAVVRLLLALLCLGFALWAWRIVRTGGARPWGVAGAVALAACAVLAWPLLTSDADRVAAAPIADRVAGAAKGGSAGAVPAPAAVWQPYTPTAVASQVSAGRAVFVDFTAAWCVTCQVNKRLVLEAAEIRSAFAQRSVALLRADWTRRDPDITRALEALGRSGVPVYVLFRPGRDPLLLPEVLTRQTVLDALATL